MLIMTLLACGANVGEDSGDTAAARTAALLAETETAIEGYESWNQLAEWTGIVASDDGTHGSHVQIWLNDAAFDTIEAAEGGDMPSGAILVKQGYTSASGDEESNLTVMHKVEGYGWFWASWDSGGENLVSGQPDGCTGCHASGQDAVRTATW